MSQKNRRTRSAISTRRLVDWAIDGQGPDGQPVHIHGTATDVARRGPDGLWRCAIDNPHGTS